MLPTVQKLTFYKGLYGENDGSSIMGKTARQIYVPTTIRCELMMNALQINKKLHLIDFFIEQLTKL